MMSRRPWPTWAQLACSPLQGLAASRSVVQQATSRLMDVPGESIPWEQIKAELDL